MFIGELFLVHVTMVGGPLEELKERVKTGGSASREDMRAYCMLVSTTGLAVWVVCVIDKY